MRDYKSVARVFKALDDEKRLQILDMIRGGEKCACVILEDMQISQSTLSHHMKILCESGIVHGRKDGKWVYYSIDKEGSKRLARLLASLVSTENL
ncbi:MAG: metalloregulator ArsR/SmtB family transcription factor [Selenomonadales bacterium]|nr:metalloregulator ArsR/SmtB family transcription factor [Selenomonadales bacterium]